MKIRHITTFLATALLCSAAHAGPLTAAADVDQREVFVGESFTLQIQVSGSETPQKPDLSALADFDVRELGGRKNSSQSVSFINGRVNRVVHRGYVFAYRLTPKRPGNLVIPPINVNALGQSARTSAITVSVNKPMETDDFKLRLELSKDRVYVGEPLVMKVTWYLGQDIRAFQFILPMLQQTESFFFADPSEQPRRGKQYYRVPLTQGEVIAEKGRARLDAKEYATISFRKILIPKRPGQVSIPAATVACEALAGFRKPTRRQGSPFDDGFFSDFFRDDFFGRGRRGVYRKVVVPSNPLTLRVSALPTEGRPDGFAGHVGNYRIAATAKPTEVNVGDPITLTLVLSGAEYLDHIELAPLQNQAALVKDFKIPAEMASGKTSGKVKVFTQTIRALRPDVGRIPPIRLPYFDTRTGRYDVTATEPVPLTVRAAKVVTAGDAEGLSASAAASAVEAWTKGIAHNYEDMSVLVDQRHGPMFWFKSPFWISLLSVPPLGYLLLLTVVVVRRRRHADPLAVAARRAHGTFIKALKAATGSGTTPALVMDALRRYLGAKLRIPAGALTFNDVAAPLRTRGATHGSLEALCRLLEQCEAGRYAGRSDETNSAVLEQALSIVTELERELR